MSYKLVQWALERAPMLRNGRGPNHAARLNLIARCEMQRDGRETHYLSIADLEWRTGLSPHAIRDSNRALEEAGLIVRKGTTAAGVPLYAINSTLQREDDLTAARSRREEARRRAGAESEPDPVPSQDPGSQSVPGSQSEPGPGAESEPGPVPSRNPNRSVLNPVEDTPQPPTVGEPALFGAKAEKPKKARGEEHPEFAAFWDAYRAHARDTSGSPGSRQPAARAYAKAATKATPGAIRSALGPYFASRDPQRGFCRNASTWLNQEAWNDDWQPWTRPGAPERLQAASEHPDDPFAA
ncbi:hypothetical protein [Amycolatopsis magusensis]|uniref:hypothetical protein n=1 Tax=Amycolatopsis magusensis TaxID=882444 RepID=UPI003C2E2FF2